VVSIELCTDTKNELRETTNKIFEKTGCDMVDTVSQPKFLYGFLQKISHRENIIL